MIGGPGPIIQREGELAVLIGNSFLMLESCQYFLVGDNCGSRANRQYLVLDGNLRGSNILPQARDGNFKVRFLSCRLFSFLPVLEIIQILKKKLKDYSFVLILLHPERQSRT